MRAIVVYESHWGNTAAIGRQIAAGIGPSTLALSTDEATPAMLAAADLVVAGAPVLGFRLPTDAMLATIADTRSPSPDLSHPPMRAWLERLPAGRARCAAFETGLWWSPGGATGTIERELERAGYSPLSRATRFVVKGRYGPLRSGELERARDWGRALAEAMR